MFPQFSDRLAAPDLAAGMRFTAAEVCGCDAGAVESRLSRSRVRLPEELGGDRAGAAP